MARVNLLAAPPSAPYAAWAGAAFSTPRQPNVNTATFVVITCSILVNTAGDDGQVNVLCDSSNPPTTQVTRIRYESGSASRDVDSVSIIVAPGDYYELVSATNSGAPTIAIISVTEALL